MPTTTRTTPSPQPKPSISGGSSKPGHSRPSVFSVRDLRNRSGDLLRDAEAGNLSIITKHGRPTILAVPFDERLLETGVQQAVAFSLFESGAVTLAQGAKIAGLALEAFIEKLGEFGITAVDYPPEDLEDELLTAQPPLNEPTAAGQ